MDTLTKSIETQIKKRFSNYTVSLVLGSIIALCIIIGTSLGLLALINSDGQMNPFSHLMLLPIVTGIYGVIGIQIAAKHPRHIVAWLLLIVGVSSGLTFVSSTYNQFYHYVLPDAETTLIPIFSWLDSWIWWIPSMIPLTFVLLYFPDGRLPSKRWRPLALITGIGLLGGMVATAFHPGPLPDYGVMNPNPYGIESLKGVLRGLLDVSIFLLLLGFIAAVASVIVRYRRADGITRIQLKWLVYAVSFVGLGMGILIVLWVLFPNSELLIEMGISFTTIGVTLIIIAIGIAILKYQLWDIDILINQTLVYGILSIITIGTYLIVVTFLSSLFEGDNLLFSLMATGLIAVSFQTIRDYIQRLINQLMFGDRDEPYIVLERLSKQLDPVVVVDEVLPTIVQSIGQALRLPYVAIAFAQDNRYKVAASFPESAMKTHYESITRLSLDYQSEHIGQLWLAPREQGKGFTQAENNLLETVARQASIAAYNVRLTEELQRSREEIITTREEERRRLRRDLHDGLGPILASMSFRLDAVKNLMDSDIDNAKTVVAELKEQVQSSLSEIRRIAYDLRPPALDELGLIGALREHIVSLDSASERVFLLDAPQELPSLSAAVEVATYRIAMEAITNVQRHSNAAQCTISLSFEADVELEIVDDGCGITSNARAGVGTTAMRERAAELGGKCIIENNAPHGTRVYAVIPLVH